MPEAKTAYAGEPQNPSSATSVRRSRTSLSDVGAPPSVAGALP